MEKQILELQQSLPKYLQIKQQILKDIKSGKYPPNSKVPSVQQLMRKYNIANATAAHTISELINNGILFSVHGKGCFVSELGTKKEFDYMKEKQTRKINILLPTPADTDIYFFHKLYISLLNTLHEKGYSVELYNSSERSNTHILNTFLIDDFGGLIFWFGILDKDINRQLVKLQKKNIPVVLIDKPIGDYSFDWVAPDDIEASKKATEYLIKMGHKKIAFIVWVKDFPSSERRLQGYKMALKENGIRTDNNLIIENEFDTGYQETLRLVESKKKFTAILAYDDREAVGIYKALKEKNLKVPDDISLIGFNDETVARTCEVPLTTVKMDITNLGTYAVELLLERIKEKDKLGFLNIDLPKYKIVKSKLIIRNSVKKVK